MSTHNTASLLTQILGERAAIKFMQIKHFGGADLEVPKSETGRGAATFAAIAEVIGVKHAHTLCRYYGGNKIYVPMWKPESITLRNRNIVESYNKGISIDELRREHGIAERTIRDILKTTDMTAPPPVPQAVQESLF
jgi:Mor transcription activator family